MPKYVKTERSLRERYAAYKKFVETPADILYPAFVGKPYGSGFRKAKMMNVLGSIESDYENALAHVHDSSWARGISARHSSRVKVTCSCGLIVKMRFWGWSLNRDESFHSLSADNRGPIFTFNAVFFGARGHRNPLDNSEIRTFIARCVGANGVYLRLWCTRCGGLGRLRGVDVFDYDIAEHEHLITEHENSCGKTVTTHASKGR